MGVVKKSKLKTKKEDLKKGEVKKNVANGKQANGNVKKKKKTVSCLQCIKSPDDGGLEGKYRVAAPELMQDTFMSDSEDEGGEVECPIQQQQQYRYMNSEAGTLQRAKPMEDSVTDGHLWPSNNDRKAPSVDRQPLDIGFLVSFVVDARGGAMKAKRRGGVRIIVPPAACNAPTRVTCRAATRRAPASAPPPLMEGEALASRLLELQPQGAKFLAPVIIEVPIYTAASPEREIIILRSDTGDTWQDHYLQNNDNPLIQETLSQERALLDAGGEARGENGERVCRIVTCDFPHFLAVVSRVRQEVHIIGPEGGTVSSVHIPQVQAQFPAAALTKRIRVGLQAHAPSAALARRALPRSVLVSPVITVEPRRWKFHRSITLFTPLPSQDGKVDRSLASSNLRLLCSIMGGQARAVWEDVTGSTPLTLAGDVASFTTTVSARFWLMNCQNMSDATKYATELYREMLLVPFEVRIVVLGKRLDPLEGRLLVLYITDRYTYDTLLKQEHYTEIAHSTCVRLLDSKDVYLEFSGNLVPVTKSGSQPAFSFESFKENRVEFSVRVKHPEEKPAGRIYFMNEPKVPKGEQSQTPACVLDVELPERIAPRAGKSQLDYLNLDQSGFDALNDELSSHWGEHHHSIGPPSIPSIPPLEPQLNGHDIIITNGDVKPTIVIDDKPEPPKPQVNGNGPQVDSNKTKATFDSDEDKTPMNTLEKNEKGKKKEGFFGGIAGKVKNVFGHSEDKEDSRESSPKPKPRDSKEKSPPKPAPRIIEEGLLDKVEDMFKDLHSKPPKDDDDIESKVYATKLVVEEDKPHQDDLYVQYANMQPVETPIREKTKDPFTDYYDCCEGKLKGYKHTHDETSTLVDRIETEKFAAKEKLGELGDNFESDVKDGIEKLHKEKDNIKQKSEEVTEDLIKKVDEIKSDAKDKADDVKQATSDKINDVKDSANTIYEDVNAKITETQDNLIKSFNTAEADLKHKGHEIDFLAREQAEELRNRGDEVAQNLNRKAQDSVSAAEKVANEKLQEANEAVGNAKEKAGKIKDKSKKKGKEGKNFLTGLVSGIFGEKDKLESEVKGKINDGKKAAEDLAEQAAAKKEEIKESAAKKQEELKDDVNHLVQSAQAKKDELDKAAHNKIEEAKGAVEDKKNDVTKAVHDTTQEAIKTAQDKKDQVEQAIETKKDELSSFVSEKMSEANNTAQQAEQGLIEFGDDLHSKASDAKQDLLNKKDQVQDAVQSKANEFSEGAHSLAQNAQDKANELKQAVHDRSEETQQALKEKRNEAVDGVQNLIDQASAKKDEVRDSFAKKGEELKEGAERLVDQASAKKDEVTESFAKKGGELKDDAAQVAQNVQNKKDEITNAVQNTTEEALSAAQHKAQDIKQGIHDTTENVGAAISNKAEEVGSTIKNKKDQVQNAAESEWDRIRQEAELTTEEIKRSAEEKINAAADKKDEFQAGIGNKVSALQKSGKEGIENIQEAVSDKVDDLQKSSKDAYDNAHSAALSAFDQVESAAKDHVSDAKDTWEDLQSSTRDTFADFKDDAHSWENSAQDTLHSFQSSAGNTFDSLDDSTREFIGGAQSTAHNIDHTGKELFGEAKEGAQRAAHIMENAGKELFCDAKEGFEGFQVSADNKLEDVRCAANERLAGSVQGAREAEAAALEAAAGEADQFTSSLNDLGNSVFGSSGKGFMKDSSTKLLESEKSQSSPSPQKKGSGFFSKFKRSH